MAADEEALAKNFVKALQCVKVLAKEQRKKVSYKIIMIYEILL